MLPQNLIRLFLLWFICMLTPIHVFSQITEEQGPLETKAHPANEYLQDEKGQYLSAGNSPCGAF